MDTPAYIYTLNIHLLSTDAVLAGAEGSASSCYKDISNHQADHLNRRVQAYLGMTTEKSLSLF